MKRSTENLLTLRKVTHVFQNRKSVNIKADPSPHPSLSFINVHPFSTSLCAIGDLVDSVIEKVNSTIKQIQDKKYFNDIVKRSQRMSFSIQAAMMPFIGNEQDVSCPENQPVRIPNDQICQRDSNLEKKSNNGRSKSNISVRHESVSIYRIEHPHISIKESKVSDTSKFIPLPNSQSCHDLNAFHFQNNYRQKYNKRQSIKEREAIPTLLTAKKIKKDKDHQYNFDFNGDKIPISTLVTQKSTQLNVLKTVYRVHKDRQEVRNPKKIQERISFSRFPSVHHSKNNMDSNSDLHELKSGIQKSCYQKGCKLSSIKFIQEDK